MIDECIGEKYEPQYLRLTVLFLAPLSSSVSLIFSSQYSVHICIYIHVYISRQLLVVIDLL